MVLFQSLVILFGGVSLTSANPSPKFSHQEKVFEQPKQVWNYTCVRDNAHMFWWLYYTTAPEGYTSKPLVIWLQGGPGASSTGFGNFQEIGPLDINQNPRNTTWVSVASVLFIDNPVGTGFSYVTSDDAYTTDVQQIADDLLVMIAAFFKQLPDFQTIPLYIFSESYGGKMAAAFSQVLYKAIQSDSIKCDFRGFAMGDSWISPVDSVLTWGPYLYATSLVDEVGLRALEKVAYQIEDALVEGQGRKATGLWSEAEYLVNNFTGGVNVYNILKWGGDESRIKTRLSSDTLTRMYGTIVGPFNAEPLADFMNGPVRKMLKIIPDNVVWGGQSGKVFDRQAEDFMKPVVTIVEDLLETSKLDVVVYSGQLDLIVDTLGTEEWVQNLKWTGLPSYNNATRTPFYVPRVSGVAGFVKMYKNFAFYWILDAGHMIPTDAGDAALVMLKKIIH